MKSTGKRLGQALQCAVLGFLLYGGGVQAQELRISIVAFSAPEVNGCPTQAQYQRSVVQLLGRDPFASSEKDAQMSVGITLKVVSEGGKSTAEGELREGGAVRRFHANDCPALAEQMALALAIAVDPFGSSLDRSPSAPKPVAVAERDAELLSKPRATALATAPESSQRVEKPGHERLPIRWTLHLQPLLDIGSTPEYVLGLAVGGEARLDSFSLQLQIQITQKGRKSFAMGALDAQRGTLSLAPCWHHSAVSACATVNLGILRARGLAPLVERKTSYSTVASAGSRLYVLAGSWQKVALRPFVQLRFALLKTRLQVGTDAAWTSPSVIASTGISLEY